GGSARRTVLIVAAAVVVVAGAVAGILLSMKGPVTSHPMAVQSSAHGSGRPSVSPSVAANPGAPNHPALSLHDPGGKNVFGDVFSSETTLVTGDGNGSSYVWDLKSGGSLTSTLQNPNSDSINSIAFNANSNTYAIAGANSKIYLWNAGSNKLTATLSNGTRSDNRVAISPDGSMGA